MQTREMQGTTTVGKPPAEVFGFWRELTNLPTFMAHVDDITVSGRRSHWTVTAPFGRTVEWDADIIDEVPDRSLRWQSLEGADVANSGSISFVPAPGDQGTEVHVTIEYSVPGGTLGEALARWAGEDPHQQLDDDLRRFKQVMETGEVVRSDGAPYGKRARKEFPQHPAQPLTDEEFAELVESVPAREVTA